MSIPLTVVGGYLGAGKTTLLNRLLLDPGGRRLAVVVNDFGAIPIDVERLAAVAGADGVVSLPNGCICCTLGNDLGETLRALAARPEPPEQIVIEASGVADPAAVAAWSTVPPFAPGGVVVLLSAADARRLSDDRYVRGEVERQLRAAELILVTKPDLVDSTGLAWVSRWLDTVAPQARRVAVIHGEVPIEVVLGFTGGAPRDGPPETVVGEHAAAYTTWTWQGSQPIGEDALGSFLSGLGSAVLRLKGELLVSAEGDSGGDGASDRVARWVAVDVVGPRRWLRAIDGGPTNRGRSEGRLVAIGLGPLDHLTAMFDAALSG